MAGEAVEIGCIVSEQIWDAVGEHGGDDVRVVDLPAGACLSAAVVSGPGDSGITLTWDGLS